MSAALEVVDVGLRLADSSVLLAPTSLCLAPGERVAVVGRSGVGKSTLAEIVLGLRHPTQGEVRVLGEHWCSPGRAPERSRRALVQGVPQDAAAAFVPRWTLRRSIGDAVRRLAPDPAPEPTPGSTTGAPDRVEQAARLARLDPALLDRRPARVSGGQAQRAAIARAIAVGPAVLVVDEPTSALDADTAAEVAGALLDLATTTGTALLLLTHDPAIAARCDRTLTITAPEDA